MEKLWLIWLAMSLIAFAVLEVTALVMQQPTLSRTMWQYGVAHSWFPPMVGFAFGFLLEHFFG